MEEKVESKKGKYHNQSIFVWIVVLFLAWTLGQYVFPETNGVFLENSFLISLLAILSGYILFTLFYEIGKIIFGKISGYKFVYCNILGFTFVKNEDNKVKFKFSKFTCFGGKTIMPPKKDKANLVLYSLGGIIFTIIMNVILLIVTILIGNNLKFEELTCYQYIMSAVSVILLIFHIAPVYNDGIYDGFIIRICHKNEEIKNQYHKFLLQEEKLLTYQNDLIYIDDNNLMNPLTNKVGLNNAYYLLKNDNIEEAYKEAKKYLDECFYLSDEDKGYLYSIKFYYMLLNGKFDEVNEEYRSLDGSVKRVVSNHNNYGTVKTALLIAVFIESSYDLYEYIIDRLEKNKYKYNPYLQESEEKLIEHALLYIEKTKVEWFKNEE